MIGFWGRKGHLTLEAVSQSNNTPDSKKIEVYSLATLGYLQSTDFLEVVCNTYQVKLNFYLFEAT